MGTVSCLSSPTGGNHAEANMVPFHVEEGGTDDRIWRRERFWTKL